MLAFENEDSYRRSILLRAERKPTVNLTIISTSCTTWSTHAVKQINIVRIPWHICSLNLKSGVQFRFSLGLFLFGHSSRWGISCRTSQGSSIVLTNTTVEMFAGLERLVCIFVKCIRHSICQILRLGNSCEPWVTEGKKVCSNNELKSVEWYFIVSSPISGTWTPIGNVDLSYFVSNQRRKDTGYTFVDFFVIKTWWRFTLAVLKSCFSCKEYRDVPLTLLSNWCNDCIGWFIMISYMCK